MKLSLPTLILLCLSILVGQITVAEKLMIVTEEGYPLNYTENGDTKVKGFSVDLVKAVMDNTGLDYEIKIKPWARAFQETITNNNTLIFSIGRLAEREDQFVWLGELITVTNKIYALTERNLKKVDSVEKLKGEKIAVSRRGMNHFYLKKLNFENLVYINSNKHAYELMKRNRLDYYASSVLGMMLFVKKNNLALDVVESIVELEGATPTLYLAGNKNLDKSIVEKITNSFVKIRENGTYYKIMQPLLDEQTTLYDVN